MNHFCRFHVSVSARFQPSVPGQVAAVSAKESSEARGTLESQGFWTPQAGSHKAWLKALCTTLLDSGGVKSEALLLTRPLCLVRSQAPLLSPLKSLFPGVLGPGLTCACLQVWVECCQRLLPLIIHSILLDDSTGSWRTSLSSHIQDFFSFCCRSAQASSRSATPLNSDSGECELVTPDGVMTPGVRW